MAMINPFGMESAGLDDEMMPIMERQQMPGMPSEMAIPDDDLFLDPSTIAGLEIGEDGTVRPLSSRDLEDETEEMGPGSDEHRRNIAEELEEDQLDKIGEQIIEAVERDIEDREPWMAKWRRGLEVIGAINNEVDDGPFPGASTVTHPLIQEASVQFWARAQGELVPSDGPVKVTVTGKQSVKLNERADRVARYMNHELMFGDKHWYAEMSRAMMALPLQGSVFKKVYRDESLDRNVSTFVMAEDLIAPSTISSLETAHRYTHRIWMTENEMAKAQYSGRFRECELEAPEAEDLTEGALARLEAASGSAPDDEDSRYELYEHYCELDIEGLEDIDERGRPTGIAIPYVVTVERHTGKVLSIYNNFKEDDSLKRALCCFVHYTYIPGHNFYGQGLYHLIGGIQEGATGALRAILDGSATASLQGGYMAKDAAIRDTRLTIEPGVYKSIEATAEDLSKAFFNPPFKEPSPALYQMLIFLTEAGQKFSSTTEIMTGEQGSANAPVGSTIAIIEQAQKVFSSIHRGLHKSLGEELMLRYELIYEYMPEGGYESANGEDHDGLMDGDFEPGLKIIPVSDPNIFSSAQRVAVAQAEYQLAQENPDLMKRRVALKRFLTAIKSPDAEELLVSDDPPIPMDPASEIASILRGEPVQAYPEQPHQAHIQHYTAFMLNPGFGGNPQVMQRVGPAVESLMGQRLAYLWQTHARANGVDVPMLLPHAIAHNEENDGKAYQPTVPPEVIAQQLAQFTQQMAQAPGLPKPPDPNEGKMQIEAQKLQMDTQKHQAEMQLKNAELELKKIEIGRDTQIKQAESAAKQAESAAKQREMEIKALEYEERVKKMQLDTQSSAEKLENERVKMQLEIQKAQEQLELERAKLAASKETEDQKRIIEIAKLNADLEASQQKLAEQRQKANEAKKEKAKAKAADVVANVVPIRPPNTEVQSASDRLLMQLIETLSKPRRVIYDVDGNVVGTAID